MAYTETTTIGYGSRVGNSFRSIGTGFLLFIAGTALLWWNEGRVVKTDKMLYEAEGVTVELETIDRINPEMDGKLVHATGFANTEDSLVDAQFGIGATAIRLARDVEYYQWVEHSQEQHKDKLGGSEEIVITYTYTKEWTSEPEESSLFHDPAYKKKNFVLAEATPDSWQAEKVTFGAFVLNERQIRSMSGDEPVKLSFDSLALDSRNKELRQVLHRQAGGNTDSLQLVHVSNNHLYYGISPSSPDVGDVRITWTKVMPAKVTIIAKQTGDSFASFKAKNGKTFSTLVMGTRDAAEIYEGAHQSNHLLMWMLRFLGVLLVIIGLNGIFGILETVLKVVPFLANIIGWGVGLVCMVTGLVWSLIIIALAWLFYRPLIGIGLLAIAALLIWFFAFRGKVKLKQMTAQNRGQNQQNYI
ncbi:MAG: TMEM43 family protein [Bacteroidaceae bacterium]|nr:TMEM43 family protein [Bacteroidaceae bacterium]